MKRIETIARGRISPLSSSSSFNWNFTETGWDTVERGKGGGEGDTHTQGGAESWILHTPRERNRLRCASCYEQFFCWALLSGFAYGRLIFPDLPAMKSTTLIPLSFNLRTDAGATTQVESILMDYQSLHR